MKYRLSANQSNDFLLQADEIFVQAKDYKLIPDLILKYPDKKIILDTYVILDKNIKTAIKDYRQMTDKICCKIYDLKENFQWFLENNIEFYYGIPVNNFYDLKGVIDLGVSYAEIEAPLTFSIKKVHQMVEELNPKVQIIAVPNVAYDAHIPRKNGIFGQWIRPEDVSIYEEGIDVFYFKDADLEKEKTLYKIYAKQKSWPGNLNMLLTNFNINIDNRAIIENTGERRSNCGQACLSGKSCHFCENLMLFYNILVDYKNNNLGKKEN